MIKKITLAVAVVLFAISANAQIQFGVKGGVNLANQTYEVGGISASPDMLIGFQLGGFASFNLSEQIALQPELLFSQYGCKVADLKFNMNYISVPVMVKYSFGAFKVMAGPQLGYLISAKFDGEDAMDGLKKIDMGVAFGAGYEMENGIGIDARYYLGLANVADVTDYTVKNSAIQIAVSYKFK